MTTRMFHIGLDLGQLQDYSALTVTGEVHQWHGGAERPGSTFAEYQLRHVERFPLGTSYQDIARRVKALQDTEELKGARLHTVVDTTGVGLPVFEMLKTERVRGLVGVTITGGESITAAGSIYRVPKRALVSTLQVLLQNGALRFAANMPLADVLRKELQAFRARINIATGNESFEAWRERDHDDLVLSLAVALWHAHRPRSSHRRRTIAL